MTQCPVCGADNPSQPLTIVKNTVTITSDEDNTYHERDVDVPVLFPGPDKATSVLVCETCEETDAFLA